MLTIQGEGGAAIFILRWEESAAYPMKKNITARFLFEICSEFGFGRREHQNQNLTMIFFYTVGVTISNTTTPYRDRKKAMSTS